MSFDAATLEAAHANCVCHREELKMSDLCGCIYCEENFPPTEIEEWVEETTGDYSRRSDPWTAVCPKCGIDSVIGSASGLPVHDPEFLNAMHKRWFE